MNANRIFVYGTLMTGECRHWFLERAGIVRIRAATVRGTLFDFGEYPGLRLSSSKSELAHGELTQCERLQDILQELDEEEGAEFRREFVTVRVDGGSEPAYVYALASAPTGVSVIASGDWKLRGRERGL